jgi:hypothetical protein
VLRPKQPLKRNRRRSLAGKTSEPRDGKAVDSSPRPILSKPEEKKAKRPCQEDLRSDSPECPPEEIRSIWKLLTILDLRISKLEDQLEIPRTENHWPQPSDSLQPVMPALKSLYRSVLKPEGEGDLNHLVTRHQPDKSGRYLCLAENCNAEFSQLHRLHRHLRTSLGR